MEDDIRDGVPIMVEEERIWTGGGNRKDDPLLAVVPPPALPTVEPVTDFTSIAGTDGTGDLALIVPARGGFGKSNNGMAVRAGRGRDLARGLDGGRLLDAAPLLLLTGTTRLSMVSIGVVVVVVVTCFLVE
jgi:hypothetical protein